MDRHMMIMKSGRSMAYITMIILTAYVGGLPEYTHLDLAATLALFSLLWLVLIGLDLQRLLGTYSNLLSRTQIWAGMLTGTSFGVTAYILGAIAGMKVLPMLAVLPLIGWFVVLVQHNDVAEKYFNDGRSHNGSRSSS